jgi:hypothetical protein
VTVDSSEWMTSRQASAYLGFSVHTLYGWRSNPTGPRGPRSYRVSGQLRYRRSDLDRWLEQNSQPGDLDEE